MKNSAFIAYKTFCLTKGDMHQHTLNRPIAAASKAGPANYWWKQILITSRTKAGPIKRRKLQFDCFVFWWRIFREPSICTCWENAFLLFASSEN